MADIPKIRFKGFTDDWEQRKVGEYYDFKNGLNKGKSFFGSGTPIVNFTDVFHNRGLYASDLSGRVTLSLDEISNYEVWQGDIFFTRTSETIEEIGYPSVMLDAPKSTVFSGFVLRGRAINTDPLTNLFKQYVFFTSTFRLEMIKKSSMTTRALTSGTAIKQMEFLFPHDKDEQDRIGAFFSTLDHLITLHQRKCDDTIELKKYMLQKMFPQNGKKIPEIRFAGFTDDWKQRKLGEIVEFLDTQRKPLEGAKRVNGPYPYYGASGIVDYVDGYIFDEELVLLSEDGANITDRNYPICFLASGKYWVNNHAHVLKMRKGNENNFVCNALERKDYNQYNTGMAMPKLNKEVCKNIPIFCPCFEEQKKIGDYFRHLDHLITLHQRKCNALKEIKKYMLQNMFPQKG